MKLSLEEVKKQNSFIKNTPATQEDVQAGKAFFSGDPLGIPIDIEIPQYALHTDEEGKETQVIVIQAEQVNDLRIFGARIVEDGTDFAGLEQEFMLLGANLV